MKTGSGSKTVTDEDQDRAAWRASGLGLELVGSIVGMAALGWAIDYWAGTAPRWLMILLGVGIVGGSYNFIRQAMALNRKAAEAYRKKRAERGPEADPGPSKAKSELFDREEADWAEDEPAAGDDADEPKRNGW